MFTDTEKTLIRLYLGFPNIWRDANPMLESAIDVVGNQPATVSLVQTLLTNIENADNQVNQALLSAGIKKVDEVEFFGNHSGNSSSNDARKNGRMWVNRLSIIFGVPIQNDVFSNLGYQGNNWGASQTQVYGNANCNDLYSKMK